MRAVTWHGTHDVRVDTCPIPRSSEPTDAIIRVTSTGICGSDLHLYEVLGPYIDAGDILGHEPMGVVEEVGAEVTDIAPGDRVVIPFNISCGHCFMCDAGLMSQCETTQVREHGTGAALLGYTKLYGQVPGGQAEYLRVPQAHFGPIKVPDGPPDDRFVYLSDVLPTAWQAVEYADIPDGGSVVVLGLGPIGEMSCRIAQHRGAGLVIGIDLVPERLARAERARRAHDRPREHRRRPRRGARADRRPRARLGHRRRRHGGARRSDRQARPPAGRAAAGRRRAQGDRDRGHRPPERAAPGDRAGAPRRHGLAVGRLRRRHQPDAAAADVRQAAHDADGPGQRAGAGSTICCRCCRTAATRSASTTSPRTTCRSTTRRAPTRSSRRSRTAPSRCCSGLRARRRPSAPRARPRPRTPRGRGRAGSGG